MARGDYQSNTPKAGGTGWKPLLVLGGVAAGLYLISPGGREWLARGKLPPPNADDELAAIAHAKGFANVEEYERAVRGVVHGLRAEGFTVVETPNAPHIAERLR